MDFLGSKGQINTGIFAEAAGVTYPEEGNVLEAATKAEFGIDQPMRSWLRGWFDENKAEIEKVLAREVRAAYAAGRDFDFAAEHVALWLQADIQLRITKGIAPANHPETITKKGSSTPLIDSGLLKSSIVSHFDGKAL